VLRWVLGIEEEEEEEEEAFAGFLSAGFFFGFFPFSFGK
jgi:hypothetical protein